MGQLPLNFLWIWEIATVLQQISISEFKLPKGALSIIEEEFGFVKEGFDAVPFGLYEGYGSG